MKAEKKEEMKQGKLLNAFNGSAKLNSAMSRGPQKTAATVLLR